MSTLKANTISNAAGSKSVPTDTVVDGSAKAWVNFNGEGTVAIRASFNVSSVTDSGVGQYDVNFTSPFMDTYYCVTGFARYANSSWASGDLSVNSAGAKSASSMRIEVNSSTPGYIDSSEVGVAFFR
jgi:hypothetical protein